MSVASNQGSSTKESSKQTLSAQTKTTRGGNDRYVLPIVHVSLPKTAVNVGFRSALAASATLGVVDLPHATLIGGGVLIARHDRCS